MFNMKKKLLEELMAKMGSLDGEKIPKGKSATMISIGIHPQDEGPGHEGMESSELEKGEQVELEHGGSEKDAEKIAKDHLSKNPDYYSRMSDIGLGEEGEMDGEGEGEGNGEGDDDEELDPRLMEIIKKKRLSRKK